MLSLLVHCIGFRSSSVLSHYTHCESRRQWASLFCNILREAQVFDWAGKVAGYHRRVDLSVSDRRVE